MKILNYTPNDVNLYSGVEYDSEIRKYKGGNIIRTFPSIGILNARMEEITEFVREDDIIFFKHKRIVSFSCDDLPTQLENTDTYLIVTRVYLEVAKQKGGCLTSANCWRRCRCRRHWTYSRRKIPDHELSQEKRRDGFGCLFFFSYFHLNRAYIILVK